MCAARANPHYQDLRNRIDSIITQDFSAATEYATVFEEHRKVYTYGQTWNFEAYSSKKKYVCQLPPACNCLSSAPDRAHCTSDNDLSMTVWPAP